jgi:hypothetical protein
MRESPLAAVVVRDPAQEAAADPRAAGFVRRILAGLRRLARFAYDLLTHSP